MECPSGQVYHGHSQRCRDKDETNIPKPYDEKALGRAIVLGALWDARKSHIDTNYLWDFDTINNHKMQVDPGTETNVWVQHNGQKVPESVVHATNDQSSFGHKIDNTGTTHVLELVGGSTISLFTDNEDANL